MASDHILALLISERNKLTKAIEALQGPTERQAVTPVAAATPVAASKTHEIAVSKPAKRKLSAAGRRAIIEGTKKRWAAFNAAKAAAEAPVAVTAKAAPAKAAAKASPANAAFRKKMSERMKAAWAVRKKKAASNTK